MRPAGGVSCLSARNKTQKQNQDRQNKNQSPNPKIKLKELTLIAIYHLHLKIITRGKGASAVASAAYRIVTQLYVILAYFGSHKVIPIEYPAIYTHLKAYEGALKKRGQVRYTSSGKPNTKAEYPGQHHWLELDNNPRQEYMDDFSKQKIVWGNLNLAPKYALAESGMFINAPSPMIVPGTRYLLAFLNSQVCDWYFKIIAVERSGGFFEYKPMFIEQLPIPIPTAYRENALNTLVDKITTTYSLELELLINQYIYEIFNFTADEIEVIVR